MNITGQLEIYLSQRRALGFQLTTAEYMLRDFCRWLTSHGLSSTFTINDAVQWARGRPGTTPTRWSQRLTAVRPFAAWLNASGADVPVIPRSLLPARTTRRRPYIYSQRDLDRLLTACPLLFGDPRVAATMRTIIGLIAVTGLRLGETLRLTVPDLDADANVLMVHGTKTPLDRWVPLDPSTTAALIEYVNLPQRLALRPAPDGPIFVNNHGTRFVHETIEQHFRALVDALQLTVPGHPRPRLHDLRHTFATGHMVAAYTHGGDPARTLTLLSTWLGHTNSEHTEPPGVFRTGFPVVYAARFSSCHAASTSFGV